MKKRQRKTEYEKFKNMNKYHKTSEKECKRLKRKFQALQTRQNKEYLGQRKC